MTLLPSSRALTVRSAAIPELAGAPALVPLKLQGREGVNSLFEYRLVLQTPDAYDFRAGEAANFDLNAFVGLELTCAIELEGHGSFVPGVPGGLGPNQGAGEREISGLVTQARFIGESSRHALYELTLRPWLHLATLTTDCRVFQDRSPIEIIEDVLARYAFACERRLIETYPRVDYTVQYNESDFEFITRLMQEWGINYHFEHTGGVHRLVWSDHNGAFQPTQSERQSEDVSAYHHIPFYPLGHKIDREYIHGFSPTDGLTSGSYAQRVSMMKFYITEDYERAIAMARNAPHYVRRWRDWLRDGLQAELRNTAVQNDGLRLLEAIKANPVPRDVGDFIDRLVHDSMAGFIDFGMPEFELNGYGIAKFRRIFFGNDGDKILVDAVERSNRKNLDTAAEQRAQKAQWDREAAGYQRTIPR